MPDIKIDGILIDAPRDWTILDAARFLGLEIPTLCHHDGLSEWGGCRLCIVEIGDKLNPIIVTSCTYPVQEGLVVRTATKKIIETRKVILELLIAQCPTSKTLQDLAAKMGLTRVRFKPKWEDCIYCGLCVRMCEEQMMASAIGFVDRGNKLRINTPFNKTSEICRRCGGCIYICPVCMARCEGVKPEDVICGRCQNSLQPTCIEFYDNYTCWEGLKGDCGTCVKEKTEIK
ncbi:MAG: (2Fe-2S)-binding protein [Bacteroidetes bacterium]|nr:(2Fe-2S)-binding protein [Bacteroidota bacterium]MBU1423033.1 (2Fe-2S)-binding protein [Bacteroidota bacterium]MBU2637071.1 (2Fe-2S)-binding protein [Bacteroidota bacterium]